MALGNPPPPKQQPSPLGIRLDALEGNLTRSEALLAQWLRLNESSLGLETGATIATKTGLSEITVSRFLRRLGYRGIAGLKEDLQASGAARLGGSDLYLRLVDNELGTLLRRDAEEVLAIAAQIERPEWSQAIQSIHGAAEVFVTGFQTVKGAAEDFARRLSLIRPGVRFVTPHDSGLAEWIGLDKSQARCLILIDTVPYAREAEPILQLAVSAGMSAVVLTEELNTWAMRHTPYVFFVGGKVHAYVESSGPLVTLLGLVAHAVADRDPAAAKARLAAWPNLLRGLNLF